ncbi:hypothetical protein ACN267_31605 [Micromonospora sp. WMMD734]|uniref:hypothetical protein n=1 Tax=Micromonospora sp. WMMD734 TaxID=3404129 RepID=UPI003B92B2C2
MTSDPAPSYPSDPPTQTSPASDPWALSPDAPPPPAAFPAPPAQQTPSTAPFPTAPPLAAPVNPATSSTADPYSAPPAQFSAPPAQFPAPAGVDPYAAPVGQPGPYPPQFTPQLPGAAAFQQPAAVQIGEIMVSPPVIRTPSGMMPLAGATWYVTDHWQREEKIASWAMVCAILGFFCLTIFSLLFLLIKETRYHGTVQVTVTSGGHQYVARIPVLDQGQVQQINNQVNYARSLSAL